MQPKHKIRLLSVLILVGTLFFSSIQIAHAQQTSTITATGLIGTAGDTSVPLTLTFSPLGGEVNGTATSFLSETRSDGTVFSIDINWLMTGTFSGGDGGTVTGDFSGTVTTTSIPTFYYSGTWSGNLYANGTGNGTIDTTVTTVDDSSSGQFTWQVSFSPEEFAANLEPTVSADEIYKKYGIQLISGTTTSGSRDWNPHEIKLMNDVLSELPKEMLAKMSISSIARSDQFYKGNKLVPDTFGVYHSDTSVIEILDFAHTPFDFSDDASGDKEFKATILHEMVHSMQFKKDEYSNYDNPYKSPLVQSYMDATTPVNAVDTGIWENGWTYFADRGKGSKWKNFTGEGNSPPTDYGLTNPMEDLSESVMMYVYNPDQLKNSSPLRYEFIRNQIFGGIEYENGTQKTQ